VITRRRFNGHSLVTFGLMAAPRLAGATEASRSTTVFQHGVASGDPLTDRVVLWTRVDTRAAELPVRWAIAEDAGFTKIVNAGEITALPMYDHTIKVDAQGLQPGCTYYYRFSVGPDVSPVGRTRTLPVGAVQHVRFAVASCANYPFGYFNAYARIAARDDLDAVLHVGDYYYEYGPGTYGDGAEFGRVPLPPKELLTLADYRTRHAQYKSDIDLQAAHRAHPWITVWDDHETANNSFRDGAENHNPEKGEGAWADRKAAAIRAYYEWMPIREPAGLDDRTYRTFHYGDLVDLIMLDTRLHGRTEQAINGKDAVALADPARTILGADQQAWLAEELRASKRRATAWRVIGQQCMFGQMLDAVRVVQNTDQWDGYPLSRKAVLDQLAAEQIDDIVIVAGDLHSSWALDIAPDPFSPAYDGTTGRGSLAVEMVTPAISSPSPFADQPDVLERERRTMAQPHIHWVEFRSRGYLLVDVTPTRTRGEWWLQESITQRGTPERLAAAMETQRGHNHLVSV
jgi:alkaline phosphatase D